MADFNSSLPVRTENAGDIAAKIVDGTIPSQALAIDASGRITAKAQDGAGNALTSQASGGQRALDVGINVAGVQVDPRSIRALTASDVVSARAQDGAGNALTSSAAGSARPLDVALRDAAGGLYSAANPLPVAVSSDAPGDEICSFATGAAVAGGASSNHDYTVSAGKTFLLNQVEASASGKLKIEIQVETAAASGVFNTKAVLFNSAADPSMSLKLQSPISAAAGARVRVIRSNRDNQAQDVYSTILGQEV